MKWHRAGRRDSDEWFRSRSSVVGRHERPMAHEKAAIRLPGDVVAGARSALALPTYPTKDNSILDPETGWAADNARAEEPRSWTT